LDAVAAEAIELRVQVANDETFAEIVAEQDLLAEPGFDNTVRCFVNGLQPDRHYFYRFLTPEDGTSRLGRTRTAPPADSDTPLTAAVCSCQHYAHGFFGAYRRLLLDDEAASPSRKIDVVIHVGDFIYENVGGNPTGLHGREVALASLDGSPRRIDAFPSGAEGRARTLDDYRYLYKTYLSDPDLQEVRARFPFVHTWDDHELINDYWQAFAGMGPLQSLKVDINQVWFEYIPAALSTAPAGPGGPNPARDFIRPEVEDVPAGDFDDDYLSQEPNALAAIRSMTIYRSLPWGRLVDLFVVDGRSYRGERGLDVSMLGTANVGYPRAPVPAQLVRTFNAGRTANGGDPPETVEYQGVAIPNTRRDAPRGSLLGARQKDWLKNSLQGSRARWKVVCNDVPMMQFAFDVSFRENGNVDDLWWTDSWDGYPLERQEMMEFIRDQEVVNVVSITGDRHANFAGVVYDDFASPTARAVIPELAGASISANCRLKGLVGSARGDAELEPLVAFDGTQFGFDQVTMPSLNAWLLHGAEAARQLHDTGNPEAAIAAADPAVNPHLTYADTDAYGYYRADFSRDALEVEFVVIEEPLIDRGTAGPVVRRRVRFTINAWSPGQEPELTGAIVEGEAPLMGLK
jgi:alkaline phosphatase D